MRNKVLFWIASASISHARLFIRFVCTGENVTVTVAARETIIAGQNVYPLQPRAVMRAPKANILGATCFPRGLRNFIKRPLFLPLFMEIPV
jgi:hypothetical protein